MLPAYARFAKFLRAVELPAAKPADPLPDHFLQLRGHSSQNPRSSRQSSAALGTKFDLKAFHEIIDSAISERDEVLDQRVDGWIAAQKSR